MYQFGTSAYDCINMQISKVLYTRLKVSKINIGSINDNYIFLPNLYNYVILGIKPFTITFKPKGSNTQADEIFPDIQPYFRFCKVHFTMITCF